MQIEDRKTEPDQDVESSWGEQIDAFMQNGVHDEWTARTARRIYAEDAEFYQLLGDR